MTLALLDSLSLPGDMDKPNEDAFAQNGGAAVVLDGATPLGDPLMPGPSDAAWIARNVELAGIANPMQAMTGRPKFVRQGLIG